MFNFFFKKNFYDGWDNVLMEALPNLIAGVFIFLCLLTFYLSASLNKNLIISDTACLIIWASILFILFIVLSILMLSWATVARALANFEAASVKEFFLSMKTVIVDAVKYGTLLFILTVGGITGFCFYFNFIPKRFPNGLPYLGIREGSDLPFIGLLTGSIFTWIMITVLGAILFYPAMRAIYKEKEGNTPNTSMTSLLKKCFILLLDNLLPCILLGVHNLFLLLISCVMLGLIPGLGGLGLARVNFTRLLLKKYDWQKEHKGVKINWAKILQEDYNITGTRSLKTFFMPWKEK